MTNGMTWQLIGEAPSKATKKLMKPWDGTDILVLCRMADETPWMTVVSYDLDKFCWRDWDGVGIHYDVATHWMPLPTPPGAADVAALRMPKSVPLTPEEEAGWAHRGE